MLSIISQEKLETKFFERLIELQYGRINIIEMKKLADQISWLKGWPDDDKAFWNAEAFMWSRKIEKETREEIKEIIANKLSQVGRNLDLGCGAYSYIPSVGFDISPKMLDLNENAIEKHVGDLESNLSFSNGYFDSVTAVFVLNYVENIELLLDEIFRILNEDGVFIAIIAKSINSWQKQKEVKRSDLQNLLQKRFNVELESKDKYCYYLCKKTKKY